MADNSNAEKNKWHSIAGIVGRTGDALGRSRLVWGLCAGVLLVLLLWKAPQWQVARVEGLRSTERFDRENEARKTLATTLGGIVLLAGGFATWRNLRLLQEGQLTDRFTKAIEQLGAVDASGKKKLEVRLGGIYALERIAKDSQRDHWPIMEVLCAYVRENAPCKQEEEEREELKQERATTEAVHPAVDIQAILTVLGRRNPTHDPAGQRLSLANPDLRGADLNKATFSRAILSKADLRGANLYNADFRGANLYKADLRGARLYGAILTGAHLYGAILTETILPPSLGGAVLRDANLRLAHLTDANLSRADLGGANLTGAFLSHANLSRAVLNEANFSGALLDDANLSGSYLSGADLSEAYSLTQAQIDAANGNADTKLPSNLHMPESWKKFSPKRQT